MRAPETPVKSPPVKIQGIKTKLVAFIAASIDWDGRGRWIEPFLGSGAVALNLHPKRALLADANPHVIRLYQDLQSGALTPELARQFLEREGARLKERGEAHYYAVRDRFNASPTSLDFLFLNRASFNGLIRFNGKGHFNVPFCRKPDRFRPALISKIVNQLSWAQERIAGRDYVFAVQHWRESLRAARASDFVYVDPPYVGRHADYFSRWSDAEADALSAALQELPARFALSLWLRNRHRENGHVARWFADHPVRTLEHFYHLGASESLRGAMTEALVLSRHHDGGTPRTSRARRHDGNARIRFSTRPE
jgi:DNA adenine methylase